MYKKIKQTSLLNIKGETDTLVSSFLTFCGHGEILVFSYITIKNIICRISLICPLK